MKTNNLTIEQVMNNEYALHLNCVRGRVYITCYDEDCNKYEGECDDAISYDRYNELMDWCEGEDDEQEFISLYQYFINLCE